MWACRDCNGAKSQKWPSRHEVKAGYRFLHPLSDVWGKHLRLEGHRVEVIGNSKAGEYTVEEIHLNSDTHLRRRSMRAQITSTLARVEARLAELAQILSNDAPDDIKADHANAIAEARELRRQLGIDAPWDYPSYCRCDGVN
jgi:hypothetical protein